MIYNVFLIDYLQSVEDEDDELYLDDDNIYDEDEEYDEEDYDSDMSEETRDRRFYSNHWGGQFQTETRQLRKQVQESLFSIFTASPSQRLYDTIMSITPDPMAVCRTRAAAVLSEVAGSTSDTLVAALSIATSNDDAKTITSLLDNYSHLLRPRDAVVLQGAVSILNHYNCNLRAISILEKELEDTLQAIYRAVRASFSRFEEPQHLQTLGEITAMRSGSSARQERIESWVESVLTSPSGSFGSVAFAAMMMGLPLPAGAMGEDGEDNGDLLNILDMEGNHDPDFDDLREEFRPNLKERFEGWYMLGTVLKGGPAALVKIYGKAMKLMPFLKGADIVGEMATR